MGEKVFVAYADEGLGRKLTTQVADVDKALLSGPGGSQWRHSSILPTGLLRPEPEWEAQDHH